MRNRVTIAAAIGMAAVLLSPLANAQPVADFYRGKTLRMLIGYGPGGGYDIYGRLVAEFLPRHIPGNPMIVPQNMPGGGSFVAAKFMAEVAPKDGTVFASLAQTHGHEDRRHQVQLSRPRRHQHRHRRDTAQDRHQVVR